MGFFRSPSKLHYGSKVIDGIYIGTGSDYGKIILRRSNSNDYELFMSKPTWNISTSLGETLHPYGSCGGEPAYTSAQNPHAQGSQGWYLYHSNYFRTATTANSKGKWLLVRNAPYCGYIPRQSVNYDSSDDTWTYAGDTWYETTDMETLGANGDSAGTFTGVSDDVRSQTVTATISVSPVPSDSRSSIAGNWGSFWIGFPTWELNIPEMGLNIDVFKKWNGQYHGLSRIDVTEIEGVPCEINGYVIAGMKKPSLKNTFWFNPNEPRLSQNYEMYLYHFVPTDEEHPELGGTIEWVGGTEPKILTWVGLMDGQGLILRHSGSAPGVTKRIYAFEAAIWR